MNKKKITCVMLLIISIIIVIIYPVRFFYLDQIGDVFTETILTKNCNSKYISEEDSKKILNNIYWDDKNHTVKSVECSYDNENWINKHVKVVVYLETSEGKKEVYYKCYFKPNTETK